MPTRAHPLRDIALAVSTLTALPLRVVWPEGEPTDAPGYYPLVGLGLGALAVGALAALRVAGWVGGAPLVIAGFIVALWAIATRMLHWDGLGDVADAFWAHDRGRRLEIMSDSSIGAFAVTAIALCIVVQTAALSYSLASERWWAVLAVPAFSRFAATCAAWFGRPARPEGLGASVIGPPRAGATLPAALATLAASMVCVINGGTTGAVVAVAGVLLALVIPHVVSLRFGGVTGDVMGASVVLIETILFAVVALGG